MRYDPSRHHRRSIRLKGYDYSHPGLYFVTICTQWRECYFGEVIGASVQLSAIGEIANQYWLEIPNHFKNAVLEGFVVMPNHVHGIICIQEMNHHGRGVQLNTPTNATNIHDDRNYYSKITPKKNTLSVIIRTYKGAVTTWCRQNEHGYFQWQRNYHEHIVRNEKELNRIRKYIIENPSKWESDRENPAKQQETP